MNPEEDTNTPTDHRQISNVKSTRQTNMRHSFLISITSPSSTLQISYHVKENRHCRIPPKRNEHRKHNPAETGLGFGDPRVTAVANGENDFGKVWEIADIVVGNHIEILCRKSRPVYRCFEICDVYHEGLLYASRESPDIPFVPHIQCIPEDRRYPTFPQRIWAARLCHSDIGLARVCDLFHGGFQLLSPRS